MLMCKEFIQQKSKLSSLLPKLSNFKVYPEKSPTHNPLGKPHFLGSVGFWENSIPLAVNSLTPCFWAFLSTSESISSEKSHAINCGWNIYLTVGKLGALLHLCCVLYTSKICHLSHCCIQESFVSHLLTVTFSSPHVFLFFVFLFSVLLFWQLCHGPCLYSFSSSLSNISLNTIAKSGMFIFLTSIFFF